MNLEDVKCRFSRALDVLYDRDIWLLHNNLNERTIAHKLAEYLQREFGDFDVDCEYNRDVDQQSGLKKINMLKEKFEKLRGKIVDGDIVEVSVFPDIVVHKRGTNKDNLLIVELKKSTNTDSEAVEFDKEKLFNYTDKSERNTLGYAFGVFVVLETREKAHKENLVREIIWFDSHS